LQPLVELLKLTSKGTGVWRRLELFAERLKQLQGSSRNLLRPGHEVVPSSLPALVMTVGTAVSTPAPPS